MKKINLIPWWPVMLFAVVVSWAIVESCTNNKKPKEPTINIHPKIDTTKHLPDVVLENPDMDNFSQELNARKKPPRPKPKPGEPPLPPVTPANGCFLLDFNGHVVSGTMWNVNGDFTSPPSGLNTTSEQIVFDRVVSYYSVFNPYILITRDENIYNSYPQNKRRRIVITATMPEGFQQSGGVAYINCFSWFDNTPAFVNSSGLQFNAKNISDATSHEGGHTLGCRHQSDWRFNPDGSCYKANEYLWANLIMGASYGDPNPRWGIGPNSLGCTIIQNDTAVIFETLRQ